MAQVRATATAQPIRRCDCELHDWCRVGGLASSIIYDRGGVRRTVRSVCDQPPSAVSSIHVSVEAATGLKELSDDEQDRVEADRQHLFDPGTTRHVVMT